MKPIRHWKQRWDPSVDLVYNKAVLVNGRRVQRGDLVSPEERRVLGPHKLRHMWESQLLALQQADVELKSRGSLKMAPPEDDGNEDLFEGLEEGGEDMPEQPE